jgi:hypothetical protein
MGPFRRLDDGKQATVLNKPTGGSRTAFTPAIFISSWDRRAGTLRAISRAHRRKAAGRAHGIDVDEQGNGTVTEQRLYQLIRQPKPIADRQFEIEFLDPGVEAFAFTFG